MFSGIRKALYKVSRGSGAAASKLADVDAILSANPKKIARRIKSKTSNKFIYKTANKISKKINKR